LTDNQVDKLLRNLDRNTLAYRESDDESNKEKGLSAQSLRALELLNTVAPKNKDAEQAVSSAVSKLMKQGVTLV
jgi:hypothetical protein